MYVQILDQNFIIKDILKKKNDVHWISVWTIVINRVKKENDRLKQVFNGMVQLACQWCLYLKNDQVQQNAWPDLYPNRLTLWWHSWKYIIEEI